MSSPKSQPAELFTKKTLEYERLAEKELAGTADSRYGVLRGMDRGNWFLYWSGPSNGNAARGYKRTADRDNKTILKFDFKNILSVYQYVEKNLHGLLKLPAAGCRESKYIIEASGCQGLYQEEFL